MHNPVKHWISSTLFVECFYVSPPVIKNKFSANLRELEGTIEKYVSSK